MTGWWERPWRLLAAGLVVLVVGLSAQVAAERRSEGAQDDLSDVQADLAAAEASLRDLDQSEDDVELQVHLARTEREAVLDTAENVLDAFDDHVGASEQRLATAARMAAAVRADDGAGFNAGVDAQDRLDDDAVAADDWFRAAAGVMAADLDRLRFALEDLATALGEG
jgi:hypothetical protein